jgi:hypothetical protein
MDIRRSIVGLSLLVFSALNTHAGEVTDYRAQAADECPQSEVDAHVREQLATYGPRSKDREYFGFIFVAGGEIGSAVIEGRRCPDPNECSIDTAEAAPLIPKGAKVLGEWHTHPRQSGARTLSIDDVRGARNNRHIRCYAAYYSQPAGDIYAWNPFQTSVPTATASLVLIGSYRRESAAETHFAGSVDPDSAAIIAAHENPGIQCLSTNTNVHTAATTKKCCRKSTTSRSPSAQAAGRRDCASSCPPPCSD